MPFLISTNGKSLDDSYAKAVAELGNVLTLINIPGLEPTATRIRRDPDVWNDIRTAAETLKEHGALSGFATTVYQTNYKDISSPEFAQQMIDFGMLFGFYVAYTDPVGCSPRAGLALSREMCGDFSRRVRDVSDNYPLILVNTVLAEETRVGCPATRGAIVYVQSDGNVGACPAVPQLDNALNVKNRPLREILASDYFNLIRSERPPCLRSPEFLPRLQVKT